MTTTTSTTTTRSRRALVPVAACSLALALGACGGGGGGDEKAYVDTWNSTCASLTKTRQAVQKESAAFAAEGGNTKSTAAQAKVVAELYGRIIGSLRSGYGTLNKAEAPSKWSAFQKDLRTSLTKNDAVLAKAEAALKPQTEAAVKAGVGALGDVAKIPTPPKDLTKKLTGCQGAGIAGVSSS